MSLPLLPAQEKSARLKDRFPPDVVGFESPGFPEPKEGDMITCVPFVSSVAVQDRLDAVLGPDNWRELYDNPGDEYTRCTLEVRFEPGADWVTRVGLSNSKRLDKSHAEALRDAARKLGIGRYLSLYVVTAIHGKQAPKLPLSALPEAYQPCGREAGQKLRQLLNQCCAFAVELNGKGARYGKIDTLEAARLLCQGYNYPPDASGHVNFGALQNRHCTAMMQQCSEWLSELSAGNPAPPHSPYAGKAENKSQENPPVGAGAQTPKPQAETAASQNTSPNPGR